jgi:hypothetical protein
MIEILTIGIPNDDEFYEIPGISSESNHYNSYKTKELRL